MARVVVAVQSWGASFFPAQLISFRLSLAFILGEMCPLQIDLRVAPGAGLLRSSLVADSMEIKVGEGDFC